MLPGCALHESCAIVFLVLKHYFFALFVTAITHFILAVFVYSKGPRKLTNVTYALYSTAIAWWSSLEALSITTTSQAQALLLWRLNHVGVIFIPIFFVHFVMSLLEDHGRQRKRHLIVLSYVAGASLLALDTTPLFIQEVVPRFSFNYFINPGLLYPFFFIGWVGWAIYGLLLLFKVYARSTGVRRNQLRYFCWSMLIAYIGGAPNFLPTFNIEIPGLMPFGTYAIPAYAFFTTYAIVRYRLMDVNLALTRTTVFMAVYALALGVPLLAALSLQPQLEQRLGPQWWVWLWIICALLATAAHYANLYVQRFAENRLLAEQRRYQATLRRASEGMTRIRQLPRLLKLTVSILSRTVGLTYAAIYLVDLETKRYVLQVAKGKDGHHAGTTLEIDDPLIQYLQVHKNAVVLEELHLQQATEPGLRAVELSLRRLGAALAIPSFVHDHLLGFVVMGAKRSDQMYTDDDLKVLMTLANQAALAIENARFYEAEKERQAEMFHTAQLASLGTMAGSMGHQINNRFYVEGIVAGTTRTVLQSLDLTGIPEPAKAAIQRAIGAFQKIESDVLRGGDIVRTLLNFSKPGKQDRVAFPEVITMATDLAQYRVKFEEIDFEPVLSNPLPMLDGNKNQLTEAVYNLIANAYDAIKSKEEAIKEGRLTLATGYRYRGKIAISVAPIVKYGTTWLQAVVHDTGIGIKPENLSKLFVPFFTTKATAEKGTGLGLYVIKKIIENHGGKLDVNSVYGEGTTFTVHLPTIGEAP